MDPLLHYFSLQLSRAVVDSPELARRRELLDKHARDRRERRAQRRRDRVRWTVALILPVGRRRGHNRELADATG
jgi:hypothetical protein